ncbi:MAG: class I SAM-dependent DNA methyltransferase [Dethiobacteria bacterium]|jgi:SAM-dependent methyltransferase
MENYQGLAQIYDYLLSGIDYENWANYLERLLEYFKIEPVKSVVDLACGTGNSTFPWARRGYRASGVDISAEMLALAQKKAGELQLAVDFYRQDLRELALPFKADLAVLYQDGLNYLLTEGELQKALQSVHGVLNPSGHFIFNINLVEKLPAGNVAEVSWLDEDDLTLIWESNLEEGGKIWRIKLTAFSRQENGFYEKIREEHRERSYLPEEIEPLLLKTGWKIRACYKAFTFERPSGQDRNIFYIVQRGA